MALLELERVRAGYGHGEVLHGIDMSVPETSLAAVLGPNGAGKSTLLRVIAGTLKPTGGDVRLRGTSIRGHNPAAVARCGAYLLPERRAVFPTLTVEENLRMATARPERLWDGAVEEALDLFPVLRARYRQAVGTMSGGEQQMVALARAFVARPVLLLLDEPSLGLAPQVVDEVFAVIRRFRDAGMAVVLVEQYVDRAIEVADVIYVLERGSVAFVGDSGELSVADLARQYLATGSL